MKAPPSLETLVDYGIIQDVLRPLMSGKEAQVYVVRAGGEECVAKVYKDAKDRTFKHRSEYTEGRRTRNTRDQRAMSKRTQHGRKRDEDAWRSAEVEMIYRLRDAGVRVPEPINFVEGVLVMELVKDADGDPAPRLGDLTFTPTEACEIHQQLIREVVRMLCAGVIHGDLSVFNVLMSDDGPVVIDFPQAVDPTNNPNSKKLFLRDVENLDRFVERFAPKSPVARYGEEIWSLFQANRLEPDTKLTGRYARPKGKVDTREVMALIDDANREHRLREEGHHGTQDDELDDGVVPSASPPTALRRVVDFSKEGPRSRNAGKRSPAREAGRGRRRGNERKREAAPRERNAGSRRDERSGPKEPPAGPAAEVAVEKEGAPSRRRRRRSPRTSGRADSGSTKNSSSGPASEGPRSGKRRGDPSPAKPGGQRPEGESPRPRRRRRRRPGKVRPS